MVKDNLVLWTCEPAQKRHLVIGNTAVDNSRLCRQSGCHVPFVPHPSQSAIGELGPGCAASPTRVPRCPYLAAPSKVRTAPLQGLCETETRRLKFPVGSFRPHARVCVSVCVYVFRGRESVWPCTKVIPFECLWPLPRGRPRALGRLHRCPTDRPGTLRSFVAALRLPSICLATFQELECFVATGASSFPSLLLLPSVSALSAFALPRPCASKARSSRCSCGDRWCLIFSFSSVLDRPVFDQSSRIHGHDLRTPTMPHRKVLTFYCCEFCNSNLVMLVDHNRMRTTPAH